MRPVHWLALAGALLLLSPPAAAFQEQTVGGGDAPAAAAPAPAEPAGVPTPSKPLNLSLPDVGGGKGAGTEVRIPGLGTVGVLPKLDFGLELLYGAAEQKGLTPEDRNNPDPGELQIRGTIKHRF